MLALATSALAQESQTLRDRDPDLSGSKRIANQLQEANFHYGSLYLLSRLRISDAGYSEDFYLPTGTQGGGFSIGVEAPNRLYFLPNKKVVLSAEFTPGYSFFRANGSRRQFNYLARGDAHFLLNHLYLDVYSQRADQLRAHVADFNSLATVREDETGVAGEFKYSSRTSALFALRGRNTRYPGNRFQPDPLLVQVTELDRNERNARVSVMHKTFPLTSLFVAAERSDYDFRTVENKNSSRTYAGGGFEFARGRTSLRVEAGPMRLDFDDAAKHDYSGLTAEVQAQRVNGRWRYYAGGNRDLGFSLFTDNDYYIANTAAAGVDYAATRRLTLVGNTAFERDTYDTPVGGVRRKDTASFTSVGFRYAISRFRVGLDGGWYEHKSTLLTDDDSGIRYVLHLSFTP
ncbi:MAG TPA: outer membrane beta-barrel protein [Thermoanaerobaculia bacterium]|jgi:hypothetical protein